jgi:hypothetical protein
VSYRPEFAYGTPEGFDDEPFVYSFDASNTPAITGVLASGTTLTNIPFLLQQDAPFILHGWRIEVSGGGDNTLRVQVKDPQGNYLMDDYTPVGLVSGSFGQNPPGAVPVLVCPPRPCPAGGVFTGFLKGDGGSIAALRFIFYGVKRYKQCVERCAA